MAVLKRVCDDTPRTIRELNPETPDWLAAIIGKLQAKDPANRFQSASDLAELLGQHLAQLQQPGFIRQVSSVPVSLPLSESERGKPSINDNPKKVASVLVESAGSAKHRTRRMVVWMVAVFAVLLGIAGVVFRMTTNNGTVEVRRDEPSADDLAKLAGLLVRGHALIRQTRFADLGPIADEALKLDPQSPGALALRATFRAASNDLIRARADVEAALELNPETYRALMVRRI